MRRHRTWLCCTLLALLLPLAAVAQDEGGQDYWDLSLDELLNTSVTTASKRAQSISEAPAIVTVITEQQIEDLGVQTLSQLMSYVPGFTVSDTYWKRNIVTARGVMMTLYNDKILMLINGIPAYDAAALEHYLDTVPVNGVKRIEIIRGPGSTLYGTNAFSAVINVIMKEGGDVDGATAYVRGGSFDTSDLGMTFGKNHGDWEYVVSGRMINDDGYTHQAVDEKGATGEINYESDLSSLYAGLRYKQLKVQSGYNYQRWGKFGPVPVFAWGNMGHHDAGQAHQQKVYVNTIFEHALSDRLSTKLTAHFDWMDKQSGVGAFGLDIYQNALALVDTTVPPDYYRFGGYYVQGEAQAEYELSTDWRLIGGVQAENRTVQHLADLAVDLDGDILFEGSTKPTPFSVTDYGVYLQADGRFLEKFGLAAGVRANYLGTSEEFYLTPRAGLVYNPFQTTSLKLLYGEAFRSPGPQEQFYNVPGIIFGPDVFGGSLEPERIRTVEVAIDQGIAEKYNARVNAFYIDVFDIIGRRLPTTSEATTVGSARVYDNLGDQALQGLEAELKGYPQKSFNFFTNLSYTMGTDQDTDEDILYLANFTSSGGFNWLPVEKLTIGPNYIYVGERDGRLNSGEEFTVDDYFLLNLKTSYRFNSNLTLGVESYNLLGTEYEYAERVRRNMKTIPGGPGRSVYVKLSFKS